MDWIGEESNEADSKEESNESDAAYQADLDKVEAYETDLGKMVETNEIGSADSNESGNNIFLCYQEYSESLEKKKAWN